MKKTSRAEDSCQNEVQIRMNEKEYPYLDTLNDFSELRIKRKS